MLEAPSSPRPDSRQDATSEPGLNETTSTGRPRVSVVVATRDRPDDLARCLESVLAIEYPELEVIVVDQSVTDASRARIDELQSPVIRYALEGVPGKARALNRALSMSRGELLVLTDDDCVVSHQWLDNLIEPLIRDTNVAVVFGPVVAAAHDAEHYYVPVFEPKQSRRWTGWRGRLACRGLGANMALRRTAVEAIGGWDEHIGPGGTFRSGDDLDIAYRCLAAGYAVSIDADNAVLHHGMRSYANGDVRRLHRNNYFGSGACLMKQVRCGDIVAVCRFFLLLTRTAASIIASVVRERRLTGAGRLVSLVQGARAGMLQPLDRKRRVFKP